LAKKKIQNSYCIQVRNLRYHYTKFQLFLLSLEAFEHFQNSSKDFVIENYLKLDDPNQPPLEELLNCFQEHQSLLKTKTEIVLTQKNVRNYRFLADKIDNPFLKLKCIQFSQQNQIFRFTTESLLHVSNIQLRKLNDFLLVVNGREFPLSLDLFSCVSDLNLVVINSDKKFIFSIPEQHMQCFQQFFNVFQGGEFCFEDNIISSFLFLIQFFKMETVFVPVLNTVLKDPQTFAEAIEFLMIPFCIELNQQFEASISIIIHDLHLVSFQQFQNMNDVILLHLFSATSFRS
jgi:hypothetical protein